MRVFHVSEEPGIERFDPRPSTHGDMVWAVGERLLHNYLLPRDCPRVTFYATPGSDPADVERFFAGTSARHVVAIETGWLERVRNTRLYLYGLDPDGFEPIDPGADYYVCRRAKVPIGIAVVDDLLSALVARDVELRVMPSLWKLRDAVVASSLQFSIIRWRNAQPDGRLSV